jgi:hypothetical protein
LGTGEHHKRPLNKGLAGQSPGRGTATKLQILDWGAWGHGEGIGPFDIHKTSDALAAATTIAQFSLEAVELDPLPQGHFPQVLAGVTLDIPAFTHETNHRHGLVPKLHFAGWGHCHPVAVRNRSPLEEVSNNYHRQHTQT